jgi:hypothetical protein
MAAGEVGGSGGGDEREQGSDSQPQQQQQLPEAYWRWLGTQLPAISAASKAQKSKNAKNKPVQAAARYFTLQWSMDHVRLIPGGLW